MSYDDDIRDRPVPPRPERIVITDFQGRVLDTIELAPLPPTDEETAHEKPGSAYKRKIRELIEESKRARETDPQKWGALDPDPSWGKVPEAR